MKNPSVLFLPLLLLLLLSFFQTTISSSPSVIEYMCEEVEDFYVIKDFCIKTLTSDPRSKTADAAGLGVIAVDFAAAKAADIASRTREAISKATDPYDKKRDEASLQIFSDVIASFEFARKSLASKLYPGAGAVLFVSRYAAESFVGSVDLGNLADEFVQLATLATAITVHLG